LPPTPVHAADLVVSKSTSTPLQIIEQFDLEICKARFDGESFFIPNPQNTFRTHESMRDPGQFIHSPATTMTRNKDVLTTFFREPFKSVSTAHRLFCLEQSCQHLGDAHPFLKYVYSRGFHFGNTKIPSVKMIDANEKESKAIILAIHCVVKSHVRRINKYNCRGIQVLEIPQVLQSPPFKKNFDKKILYNMKAF
jgi:hypothetical protein